MGWPASIVSDFIALKNFQEHLPVIKLHIDQALQSQQMSAYDAAMKRKQQERAQRAQQWRVQYK